MAKTQAQLLDQVQRIADRAMQRFRWSERLIARAKKSPFIRTTFGYLVKKQKEDRAQRLAPYKENVRVITKWGLGRVVWTDDQIKVEVRSGVLEWVNPEDAVLVDLLMDMVLADPVRNNLVSVDDYVQMPFLGEDGQVYLKYGRVSFLAGPRCRVDWINDGNGPDIPHIWSFWVSSLSAASC